MKATLPDGTQLEGTPDELERFVTKPFALQPLAVTPYVQPVQPWPWINPVWYVSDPVV